MYILLLIAVIVAIAAISGNGQQAAKEGEWGELPMVGCGLIFGAIAIILLFGGIVMGGVALEAFDQDLANMVTNGTSAGTPKYDAFWQERCADYRARGMTSTVCNQKGF